MDKLICRIQKKDEKKTHKEAHSASILSNTISYAEVAISCNSDVIIDTTKKTHDRHSYSVFATTGTAVMQPATVGSGLPASTGRRTSGVAWAAEEHRQPRGEHGVTGGRRLLTAWML